MTILYYIAAFAIIAVSTAQDQRRLPIDLQPPARALHVPQYVERRQNPALAYTLQLPRTDAPRIPFQNVDADLQPPTVTNQQIPFYYQYPEPSVDLQAPTEGSWNPNNDPNFYYDNMPILIDLDTPTNLHPKKFNKEDHEKKYSNEPKREFILKPIAGDELVQLQKTVNKFAKLENKKQIRKEKVPTKSRSSVRNTPSEPETAHSHYHDNTVEDISASMIHSLGVKALPGERYQFHMHGHKGPNSYKWGFDTGKGRNRQFRFEERDQDGHVKGQYGYYDKSGKLHMFNYNAHPEGGFNSESSTKHR